MRTLVATARRVPYATFIVFGICCGIITLFLDGYISKLPVIGSLGWQVVTGSMMLTAFTYQWVLFFRRVTRDNTNARQTLVLHRWVGVGITFLFALHAVRLGHTWMTALSVVFFLIALTGVLNREVMKYRQNWIYLLWLTCHIGLSAALIPLVGLHIWVALAYQ